MPAGSASCEASFDCLSRHFVHCLNPSGECDLMWWGDLVQAHLQNVMLAASGRMMCILPSGLVLATNLSAPEGSNSCMGNKS